jgi:predicted dehydrogenase
VQPDPYHCRLYASCAELLGDEGVDAVFILTNAETHARYAIAAMETGDWG